MPRQRCIAQSQRLSCCHHTEPYMCEPNQVAEQSRLCLDVSKPGLGWLSDLQHIRSKKVIIVGIHDENVDE